ncbi:PilZ domain-containing protein [Sphingomonas parva]|uniref:PilZ domain-containing protein n=1 Tax=Sphingomonas parva TaxID=2555898 RepID=A0A4Y8ZVJ0_9SPHN|nr:PilZ domain-containing protein [Sphingomonas parva]TFI60020.1 PilZ domain-containing protein [Sphingomonas parva]
MGVQSFVDGPAAGKRSSKRARVLLAAKLRSGPAETDVRLRDLSQKGALIEGKCIPPVNSDVVFCRGSICVPARVAWTGEGRAGLEFAYMIDESEVLVQLKRTTTDQNTPRFRRPRLMGEDMSEHEKKLAHLWGVSVGIAVPGE